MKNKIPIKDEDFVELYAKKLKVDPSLFKQQKSLIESQYNGSKSLFKNMFGDNYKVNARIYLKKLGIVKS